MIEFIVGKKNPGSMAISRYNVRKIFRFSCFHRFLIVVQRSTKDFK